MVGRPRRQRGDGSVFQLADSRWRAQLDLGIVNGKRVRKTVTRQTQRGAKEALRDLIKDRDSGVISDGTTLDAWLDYWLEVVAPARVREATIPNYKSKLDNHIRPTLGRVKLADLTPEHFETAYAAMRKKGLSESTVHATHAVIRRALEVATQRRKITTNPCSLIELPQAEANPRDRWTVAESRQVLACVDPGREWLRVACGLLSAMRPGEVLALRWEDVHEDADTPHLDVVAGLRNIVGKGLVRTDPKSKRSKRTIPLWAAQAEAFRKYRKQSAGAGYVFPGLDGPESPTHPKFDWRDWKDICRRAKVRPITPAGARPSGAVLMASANVPMVVLQAILGHADVTTTARYYAIADSDMKAAGIQQAEAWLNSTAAGAAPSAPLGELPPGA